MKKEIKHSVVKKGQQLDFTTLPPPVGEMWALVVGEKQVLKTTLKREDVERALNEIPTKSPYVLGNLYSELNRVNPEKAEELQNPAVFCEPLRLHDELEKDLDVRVEQAVEQMKMAEDSTEPFENLLAKYGPSSRYLSAVSNVLSQFWAEEFIKIGVRFLAGVNVNETTENLSTLADVLLKKAVESGKFVGDCSHGEPSTDFAVVVTGSYGRRELLPYSDLDLVLVYMSDGKTKGADVERKEWTVRSNKDYFQNLVKDVSSLLEGTGLSKLHLRGPRTLDEFETQWGGQGFPAVHSRMNMLNSELIYETGDTYTTLMKALASIAYDESLKHPTISGMIRSRETEMRDYRERMGEEGVEGDITLKFGRGGERGVLYLYHVGQLMDETPLGEKIWNPGRTIYGLVELGKLREDHPLHLSDKDIVALFKSLNQLNQINTLLRLRFPQQTDVRFNNVPENGVEYLASVESMTPDEYRTKVLQRTLDTVDDIWTKVTDRYKGSQYFVRG